MDKMRDLLPDQFWTDIENINKKNQSVLINLTYKQNKNTKAPICVSKTIKPQSKIRKTLNITITDLLIEPTDNYVVFNWQEAIETIKYLLDHQDLIIILPKDQSLYSIEDVSDDEMYDDQLYTTEDFNNLN